MFKNLRYAAVHSYNTGFEGPYFCLYTESGAVIRVTTDRAALLRLLNRAVRRGVRVQATTVWGPTFEVRCREFTAA